MSPLPMRYTQAARYVEMLKQSVPGERWDDVCADIQAISDMLKSNKEYVRWASRDSSRWDQVIHLSEHPELVRLLLLLKKSQSVTFIMDIAEEIAEKHRYVVVEYAHRQPKQEKQIKELIDSVWGKDPGMIFERNDHLVEGVRLTYGKQTFDTSFRHYRHNLVAKLRQS